MHSGKCAFADVIPWAIPEVAAIPMRAPAILTDFSCASFDLVDFAAIPGTNTVFCVTSYGHRDDVRADVTQTLDLDDRDWSTRGVTGHGSWRPGNNGGVW